MKTGKLIWWFLKLGFGLVLIGCLLFFPLAVVFPSFHRYFAIWLWILPGSGLAYWISARLLGEPEAAHRSPVWHGHEFVVQAPLARQTAVCLGFSGATIGIVYAAVRSGQHSLAESVLWLLGSLFCLWMSRASWLGLRNMRRAGFAIRLDAEGIHYPGLPVLAWAQVQALTLQPERYDSEYSQSLLIQMQALPNIPSGIKALWYSPLPGASVRRQTISLPLPSALPLSGQRGHAKLLAAAQAMWQRHGSMQPD